MLCVIWIYIVNGYFTTSYTHTHTLFAECNAKAAALDQKHMAHHETMMQIDTPKCIQLLHDKMQDKQLLRTFKIIDTKSRF